MTNKIITIFDGDGFIEEYTLKALLNNNFMIRLITSNISKRNKFKVLSNPGYIEIIEGDVIKDEKLLTSWIKDSNIVINLIDAFKDKHRSRFGRLDSKFPEEVAKQCAINNVQKFIHLSKLEVENIPTLYAKSKLLGEKNVSLVFEDSVILKTSLIYDTNDNTDNNIIKILFNWSKKYGILPNLLDHKIKIQPLLAEDLAKSILQICLEPSNYKGSYKIAGKDILTIAELYKLYEKILNKRIKIMWLPQAMHRMIVSMLNFKIMYPVNRILFGNIEPPLQLEQLKINDYDSYIPNEKENLINIMNLETSNLEEKIKNFL